MIELLFATHNDNKLKEVRQILRGTPYTITSLKEMGLDDEIPETGTTLEENAWIKADYLYTRGHHNVFAEDTGLEVDALGGAPGVYTARYGGPAKNANDNMNKLLDALSNKSDRGAQFRTILALHLDGSKFQFEGICRGRIAYQRQGAGGFGYDPIFIPEGYDKSFAELSSSIKNEMSHRGLAVKKFADFLNNHSS